MRSLLFHFVEPPYFVMRSPSSPQLNALWGSIRMGRESYGLWMRARRWTPSYGEIHLSIDLLGHGAQKECSSADVEENYRSTNEGNWICFSPVVVNLLEVTVHFWSWEKWRCTRIKRSTNIWTSFLLHIWKKNNNSYIST